MKINAEILSTLIGSQRSGAISVPRGTRILSPSCHQLYPVRWWARAWASILGELRQLREAPYEGGLRFIEWRDRDEA